MKRMSERCRERVRVGPRLVAPGSAYEFASIVLRFAAQRERSENRCVGGLFEIPFCQDDRWVRVSS